jgi:hypothetical protein
MGRFFGAIDKNEALDVDKAVQAIVANPFIGTQKKGDLSGVYVYKFSMVRQQVLIAYEYDQNIIRIIFLDIGSHENLYRDLK